MLDMSWGEIMTIGAVALIVIGPKDLPKALRTVGQMTAKLRRMAAEFQGQFNEAMREAELDEVKQQLQSVNSSVSSLNTGFNPIQTVRDELKTSIEAPAPGSDKSSPQGSVSQEAAVAPLAPAPDASPPTSVEPLIDLPPPPATDPAEEIAASLRREAEIEARKAAAQPATEKSDAKAE
jgi:sec-independent protein translocase protein TatB